MEKKTRNKYLTIWYGVNNMAFISDRATERSKNVKSKKRQTKSLTHCLAYAKAVLSEDINIFQKCSGTPTSTFHICIS